MTIYRRLTFIVADMDSDEDVELLPAVLITMGAGDIDRVRRRIPVQAVGGRQGDLHGQRALHCGARR